MAELQFRILGEMGAISVDSFLSVLVSSMELVKELDSAMSSKRRGILDWTVSKLGTGSLLVEVQSRPRLSEPDNAAEVVDAFLAGLNRIRYESVTPAYFSDDSLRLVENIVNRIDSDGVRGLAIRSLDTNASAEMSHDMLETVGQLKGKRYSAYGSVEGTLETISIHRRPRFNVYHSITLRAVMCTMPPELKDTIGQALGRRVIVSGLVSYNAVHEPVTVQVENLQLIPKEEDLPTIDQFIGSDPDFTGGFSTGEYIRRMRDGELQ